MIRLAREQLLESANRYRCLADDARRTSRTLTAEARRRALNAIAANYDILARDLTRHAATLRDGRGPRDMPPSTACAAILPFPAPAR